MIDQAFRISDFVTRRSGKMPFNAEVRALFKSPSGKPLVVLEYPGELFRVVRPQQIVKVEQSDGGC